MSECVCVILIQNLIISDMGTGMYALVSCSGITQIKDFAILLLNVEWFLRHFIMSAFTKSGWVLWIGAANRSQIWHISFDSPNISSEKLS